MIYIDDQAWILNTTDASSIRTVLQEAGIPMPWFDVVGRNNIDRPIKEKQIMFKHQSNTRAITVDLIAVCTACNNIRITAKYISENDSDTLEFRDISDPSAHCVSTMHAFWQQCISWDWLGDVGRKVMIAIHDATCTIDLSPNFRGDATSNSGNMAWEIHFQRSKQEMHVKDTWSRSNGIPPHYGLDICPRNWIYSCEVSSPFLWHHGL